MAEYDYILKGKDDGSIIGYDANELFAFHGSTPIAQQALTAALTTAACVSPGYGFASAAIGAHVIELVNLMRTRLIAKGIMSA